MKFVVGVALLAAATLVQGQTFRSAINVVRIDVSVVDRAGALVGGLTKDDFTVVEDGRPAPIVAFEAVNIPQPPPPPPGQAAWVTENRRDVISNRVEDRRIVMIVIDDATLPFSVAMTNAAKKIGHDVVAKLTDADRAAVVFTHNTSATQDFTTDKSRLNAAIDATRGGNVLVDQLGEFADAFYYQSAAKTLSNAVNLLRTLPPGRKAVVFISTGIPVDPESTAARAISPETSMRSHEAALQAQTEVMSAMFNAKIAQVAVYAFDPAGAGDLEAYATNYYFNHGNGMPMDQAMRSAHNYAKLSADFLEAEAASSGGLAVVGTNDYSAGIQKMFGALSTFYLIGFSSSASAAGTHSLVVSTKRADLTVRSKTSFRLEQPPKNAPRQSDAEPPKGMGLKQAMAAALPEGNLPMRVAAEPFAGAGNQHPVAIALGIHQPKTAGLASTNVLLRVDAYSADGKFVAGRKLDAKMVLRPTEADALQYEVLSSLRLKPGKYQLRLGAEIVESGLSGSVFTDVDVPDFAKDAVSMSGLALTMTPALTAAPKDAFKDIAPIFTAHRTFGPENTVSVLARIYQGGKNPPADVRVDARVVDVRDRRVFSRNEVVAAGQFAARATDYHLELPVATLDPGDYLLIVDATLAGGKTARRELRFTRR